MAEIGEEIRNERCLSFEQQVLDKRTLVIVANRGPVTLQKDDHNEIVFQKASGGLVTAMTGLARQVEATWIANATSDTDREWKSGRVPLDDKSTSINVQFLATDPQVYEGYYNVIANPLLWFLQHTMWNVVSSPIIDQGTWDAWNTGYVQMNLEFAEAVARKIKTSSKPALVMFQDYHLYLAPYFLRMLMRHSRKRFTLTHFIHIPWPGPENWAIFPPPMREAILQGLCAIDLLGFQTQADAMSFIRTCESYLPGAHVNYRRGRVYYRNRTTAVRDFPISIDVAAIRNLAGSPEVALYRGTLQETTNGRQLVVRVDRSEPSKNIVRGFKAFEDMLAKYSEHRGKVTFLAILVPSRLKVEEYQNYLDELMAAAGRVNVKFGTSDWEPVRVLVGEDYPRAVAALQLYDVLLVNPIADGMNLVAKEGPIVNMCDGVVILSEKAGAWQQLKGGALVISPVDVYDTAEALHQALVMPEAERRERVARMRKVIEREDIKQWLCWQLETLVHLGL